MEGNFIHLHVHSRLSIGASTLEVKRIPKLCAENGIFACALTDTNMMSGCAEFSDVMPGGHVQPIIGVEITLNHHTADPKMLRASALSRIVLLAQNHAGYLNLCELSRIMYMRDVNHHLGPYITFEELESHSDTFEELESHSDGVICLSGAHLGPIGMAIINNQDTQARMYAERFAKIFGDRFYMEIQRHGLNDEIKTEPMFLQIAKVFKMFVIVANVAAIFS